MTREEPTKSGDAIALTHLMQFAVVGRERLAAGLL